MTKKLLARETDYWQEKRHDWQEKRHDWQEKRHDWQEKRITGKRNGLPAREIISGKGNNIRQGK